MNLPRLAYFLYRRLAWPKRAPDFEIGPAIDPYMRRWWLIPRNRFLNVYLHHVRHSDDDRALHDHPWRSVSLMLSGRLDEHHVAAPRPDTMTAQAPAVRRLAAGAVVFRSQYFAHRLEIPAEDDWPNVWTLFITGPLVRKWGFWCPQGWVPWKSFVEPDRPGEIGRGCGEAMGPDWSLRPGRPEAGRRDDDGGNP